MCCCFKDKCLKLYLKANRVNFNQIVHTCEKRLSESHVLIMFSWNK